jgi:uncharacterized integral membrane protein
MTNLIIILTIIGGLILFAWQNLSPSLALVFFGWQSATLPLSVWILMAIVAGFFTAILISSLFQLSQSLAEPEVRSSPSRPSSSTPPPQYSRDFEEEEAAAEFDEPNYSQWQVNSAPVTEAVEPKPSQSQILAEDWETDVQPLNPSWSGAQQSNTTSGGFNLDKEDVNPAEREEDEENWVDEEPPSYETEQTPKTESWSGSVYSYGYRDTGESGVGQSEAVYDADYRVIVPPPNTQIQPDDEEDEDWIEDEPEDGPDLRKS